MEFLSTHSVTPAAPDVLLGERDLSKLHWCCRRGLLENDLFIEQCFSRYESTLTERHAAGMLSLMDLADNDLLDLMLRRCEPSGEQDTEEVREVLGMLRERGGVTTPLHS